MKILIRYKLYKLLTLLLLCNSIIAIGGLRFEENKGQVIDQYGSSRNDVLFIGMLNDFKVILKNNSLSYQIEKIAEIRQQTANGKEQQFTINNSQLTINKSNLNSPKGFSTDKDFIPEEFNYQIQRIDLEFIGAYENIEVIGKGKSNDYVNYIRADSPFPKSFTCFSYDTIIYKNVYDYIDLVFYSDARQTAEGRQQTADRNMNKNIGFKYDFIVHPGGSVSDIKIKYHGCDELSFSAENGKGKIIIKAGDFAFSEFIPESYLLNGKKVAAEYKLDGNVLSFKTEKYDKLQSLVIDPYFLYATYYGGANEDVGMEIAIDNSNNYFLAGYTNSSNNIATTGAYQTEMKGEKDAFLVKFESEGRRQWATYFGGTNFDYGHSLACDRSGNVYLAGWTQTRTGMATQGSYQFNYGGGEFDAFIAKFNSTGGLVWSTYFGGQYEDYINDIVIDGNQDLVFIGRTSSPSSIATPFSFQSEFGGNFDVFLQKFRNNGNRIWGTYYGSEGFDVGMELCTDIFNNIDITGYTQSKRGMASAGAFKDTLSGIWDAFVAKFNKEGKRQWSTYYGGEDDDNGWGIGCDGYGNIYITGHTLSTGNIATAGSHQENIASEELDAIVVKFNKSGSRLWGTYFGGEDEEFGNAGAIDPWDNFIFSGNSRSDTGVATSDAPQQSRASQKDAFISKFNGSGQRLFGTYYGAGDNEFGHGVIADKYGRLLLTGYSLSSNLFTSNGAHQVNFGGNSDAFFIKIGDPIPTDSINIPDFTDTLCADNAILIPYEVSGTFSPGNVFTAQLSNISGGFSEFFDIGNVASTSSGSITGWIPKEALTGSKYRIRIVSTLPQTISDDNGLDITINELPKPVITGDLNACLTIEYTYKANNPSGLSYKWYVSGGSIQGLDNDDEIVVLWEQEGSGSVKLVETDNRSGCLDSAEINISIYNNVVANEIFGPTQVCPKNDINYYTFRGEGIINSWSVSGGNIVGDSTGDTVIINWNEQKQGIIKIIQTNEDSGCWDSTVVIVNLYDLPNPLVIGDSTVKAWSKEVYRTTASSKYNFLWTVEGGLIEGTNTGNSVYINWQEPGYYCVCLHQTDKDTGCEDSLRYNVLVRESAEEVIAGKTEVCSFSEEVYEVKDSNYTYIWNVSQGEIHGDTSGSSIEVLWGTEGQGMVILRRANKQNNSVDTLILEIVILASPEFEVSGPDIVCEGVSRVYRSDKSDFCINNWSVNNGTITGTNTEDSVSVFWDRPDSDSLEFVTGYIELIKLDTVNNCSTGKKMEVRINATEKADFTGDTIVCENAVSIYSTDYKDSLEYRWQIAGGIIIDNSGDTSITVKWGKTGTGYVQIAVDGGNNCSDSVMRRVTINKSPDKPIISQAGKTLISSADEGNQWYLSDNLIEGATGKSYSPAVSGIYTVQVSSATGCKSEMSSPYSFDINDVSDTGNNDIVLFPNPTEDYINIEFNLLYYNVSGRPLGTEIKIFDLLGNCIYSKADRMMLGKWNMQFDISKLARGIYTLSIYLNENDIRNFRLIKF